MRDRDPVTQIRRGDLFPLHHAVYVTGVYVAAFDQNGSRLMDRVRLIKACAAIRTLSGLKLTIRLSFSATDSISLTRWLLNPMPEKALRMWGHGAIARKGGMGLKLC